MSSNYAILGELGFNEVEFNFISQYMASKICQKQWKGIQLEEFIEHIADIRRAIQINSLTNFSTLSESAYPGCFLQKINDFDSFDYSYQRYDLKFIHENWLNKIYDIQNNNFTDMGLFVGSGMSALLVSLLSLKNLWPDYTKIHISQDGYFEINDFLNNCAYLWDKKYFEEKESSRPDIILLDSSSVILPKTEYWIDAKVIIIDTTCWEPGNPVLEHLIASLKNHQGIIILIRSHIKLDCFGLETGRLGSIVILSSKENHLPAFGNLKIIQKKFQEMNGNTGANFSLYSYYPWLGKKYFFALCSARAKTIRLYTDLISEIASHNVADFEIIRPQHGLFFLVKFLKNKPCDPIAFEKRIREICALGNEMGVAITPAPSFSLCYTSLRGFKNNTDNEVYLRIAPSPNMHTKQVKKIAYFLNKLLINQNFYDLKNSNSF